MEVFPDIIKHDFKEIEFRSHLPESFLTIKNYVKKMGKQVDDKNLVLSNIYVRNKRRHLIELCFRRAHENCADVFIKITKAPTSFSYKNKMTTNEFLRIFKYLTSKGKKYKPLTISYKFVRQFSEPIFPISEDKGISIPGVKFQCARVNPMDIMIIDQSNNLSVNIRFYSKPVFSFSRDCMNEKIFTRPITAMVETSNILYKSLRGMYG